MGLKMKFLNKSISLALGIAVLGIAITGCGAGKQSPTPTSTPSSASNNSFITASGVIEADNQYTVSTTVMKDILSDPFKEGQAVNVGDTLYVLDQKDLQTNISKARLGIQKAQLAYDQNMDSIAKLSVRSTMGGTVTNVYISDGAMLQAGAKIADVVDDSNMRLKVPFLSDDAGSIYVGQSANVNIVGTFYTLTGTVSDISSGKLITQNGSNVRMVEIAVQNPGTLKKGDRGTASVGNIACNDSGEFDYFSDGTIVTEVAGRVESKNVKVGDRVTVGTVAANLSNDAYTNQQEQLRLNISDAKLALETLNNQLPDYNITAKMSGTVIKKNVDINDKLSATNIGNMALIADLSKIVLKVNVDELDVGKITPGVQVAVTADSVPDKEYTGTVETVGETGNIVNGVSLYEVKIEIQNPEGLMPGMNSTAKFVLE